jgi:hypothetical protein
MTGTAGMLAPCRRDHGLFELVRHPAWSTRFERVVRSSLPFRFHGRDRQLRRTLAAGLSVSGKQWGRDDDTFGIAGVVNGITKVHQAFLNAGGLGILVGDGQLPNYGTERILETYYSFPVFAARVTLDYQLIVNPGYNRDRGPASVLGFRVHTQY